MDEMSASTRTIQQPMAKGSINGAVLMAVAALLAIVAITWGATNLVATKSVATPVQAPVFLDKGSRGDFGPLAGTPGTILDRGGRGDFIVSTPQHADRLKDDNAFGATSTGPSSVGASSAAHATRTPLRPNAQTSTNSGLRAQ
jgi:hypothetical protein